MVVPYMASIIAKKKANQLYYYVVESARVDGKPRIVNQTYLGTAERVASLIKDRAAPLPLSASAIDFGLPGALWLAAQKSGVFAVLESLWPKPRSGPSTAHYLLLAAIHRICQPGPKTEVSDWYRRTVLHSLWGFNPDRFTSQAFWDSFDQIQTESDNDQLQQAQALLLGAWKQKQIVSRRLLAYDTTNFHTYVASTNTRSQLPQRGHNKQGHHNLRQVGLSYVLDAESRTESMPPRLSRQCRRLRGAARSSVTYYRPSGPQSDRSSERHAGIRQRLRGVGQHAGVGAGRSGLDLRLALEPRAA